MQAQVQQPQQMQRNAQLIVAGGAIIAIIGFLFVPFVTMNTASSASTSSAVETYSGIQAAAVQGLVWLEFLLAAAILGVALLLAFSRNPFGMSQLSREKQLQRGIYTLIGLGVASLLLQYLLMVSIPGAYVGAYSSNIGLYTQGLKTYANYLSMSYAAGSWFYVVGMLAVLGGAGYALSLKNSALATQVQGQSPYAPMGQNQPYQQVQPYQQNVQNQQMGWQQPSSPSNMTPAANPAPPSGAMPTYLQSWQTPDQSYQQAPQQAPQQPQQQGWQQAQQGPYPTEQAWQQPQSGTNYPPQQQQNWGQSQQQPPYPPSTYGQ